MPKKTKAKKLEVRTVRVAAPSRNLDAISPLEVLSDLQGLAAHNGWRILKQFIQRRIDSWTQMLDTKDFEDIHEMNRLRDQRNIYRDLLSLPETHIKLIKENQQEVNEDPYA